MKRVLLLGVALLVGCEMQTRFSGDAKFPGGLTGCQSTCRRDGLELGAFVYSGEFATSCVCRPAASGGPAAGGADAAPTAGVEVQTQAAAAAAAASQAHQLQHEQEQARRRRSQ